MIRRFWPALLLLTPLIGFRGCPSESSPLSPLAEENPEKHKTATREMEETARRNREAEAAFNRKVRATPTTEFKADANPDPDVSASQR